MRKKFAQVLTLALLAGTPVAFAQTTTPTTPTTPPSTSAPGTTTTPSTMPPAATTLPPAATTTTPSRSMSSESLTLTEEQAKGWVNKNVYSSDGQNLGEVVAFARDGSGKVTEMHADVGGFLGIGETRVRLMPSQFTLGTDRVVLSMTSEQAKTLPKIAK